MLLRTLGNLLLLFLVANVPLAALAEGSSPPADWTVFESTAGRFRATFPGKPVESTETRDTIVGSLTGYRYEVENESRDTFFLVEYRDLPAFAGIFMSDKSLVRRAALSLLEHSENTVGRNERGEFEGHESRTLRYSLSGETDQLRLALVVLVEKRLYLVITGVLPTASQEKLAEKFVASFGFWQSK